jgi:hypothetical protein
MTSLRISTRGLMAALVVIGLGLAAIRSGSYTALRFVYTGTLLMLLVALIAASYRPAAQGAFWFGFAAVGWGYFLFAFVPMPLWNVALSEGTRNGWPKASSRRDLRSDPMARGVSGQAGRSAPPLYRRLSLPAGAPWPPRCPMGLC